MLIVAVVSLMATVALGIAHLSWRSQRKELVPKELQRPLGWRIARNWVRDHGYECHDAMLDRGVWVAETARGWFPVQEIMKWPKKTMLEKPDHVGQSQVLERV